MPSLIDEAGHTKAFDYPVAEHWGERRNVQFRIGPESNALPICRHMQKFIQFPVTRYDSGPILNVFSLLCHHP